MSSQEQQGADRSSPERPGAARSSLGARNITFPFYAVMVFKLPGFPVASCALKLLGAARNNAKQQNQ